MKSSKLRRALAVFLSAAMLILAVPFTGITAAAEDGWTEVSDADELLAALAGTGNIRFTSDISMEELSVNRSCVIDLDNHTLTITHGSVSTNACEGLTIDTADPVTFKNGTILISPGGKRVAMVINKTKSILTLEKIHLKGNTNNCGLLATNSGVRSEKITFINSTIENTNNSWTARSVYANSSTFYFKGDVNFISINKDAYSILGPGVTTINIYGNVTTNTWFRTCNYDNSTLNFYGGSIKTTGTGGKLFEYTTLALGDADKMKLYSDSGKTTPINDVTTLGTSVSAAYSTYDHTHNWTYSANENVITATCGAGGCPISPSPKLTLKANDVEYTGSPYTGASVSADYGFPVTVTNSDIKYKSDDGTTYPESTTAPTNVGSYVAYVTAGDKTASKQFSINAPTMSGISAANVTKTYDGNAYGIKVTGVPEGAVVKYGETSDGCTLSESPKYTNVGTYEIFYKVTKENYTDYINSARLIIDRADYTGEKTAEKEILAREVNENLTVALPAVPDNMSYCTPSFSSPVTAASITDGVLTFSTGNNSRDADNYYITVYVEGTGANYFDYEITVTLTAKACPHTNVETEWTYDDDGHWHKCPNCTSKRNYAKHTSAEAVKENVVDPTCTVDGSYDEVVYCSVCDYEISRTPKTTDATGHSFTNYISNGDADCLNDGTKTAACDNDCGETDTVDDVDSKTGHAWSDDYTYDTHYHWHECEHTNCPVTDNADKDGYAAHISGGEATEDNDEHCTVCGYVINPTLDHLCGRTELKFVPYAAETCTEDGIKAHYECRCGKLYSDKNAAVEVIAADLRIPAHHVWSESWSNDETQHYHLCTVCGEKNDTALHTYGDWTITKLATPAADGVKERSCTVCGYVQTGVVNYIPDNTDDDTGDVNNTTDADSNACHGDTELTKSEIIEKIDLTPEELTAVENGEDINIFLTVEDNSANVSESDKALTESVTDSDDTIAIYLDIKLFKQIGENSPTQITNTNGDVTIVFEMPESIICTDKNVTREYFIIRVHEGTAETLKCTFDPATGKASFMTDKFSSYAIAYVDIAEEVEEPVDPVTNAAEEAAEAADKALDEYTADNSTTADDILDDIKKVTGDEVTVEITSIVTVPATTSSEGSITVTIKITDSEGNIATVEKVIKIAKLPEPEKPAVTVYYPVITSGNVSADRSSAAAGETVNVKASFGYDIIVTAANGRQIAKMTENGSFVMPASKVYVTAVQNETFALMATAWRNSYVYSYDSDMNKIKVSSTKKQGVIVVNLGEDYAGKSFTIYSGRKSTKVKVTEGVLDEKGKFVFEVPDGRNYTLVVED